MTHYGDEGAGGDGNRNVRKDRRLKAGVAEGKTGRGYGARHGGKRFFAALRMTGRHFRMTGRMTRITEGVVRVLHHVLHLLHVCAHLGKALA